MHRHESRKLNAGLSAYVLGFFALTASNSKPEAVIIEFIRAIAKSFGKLNKFSRRIAY